MSETFAARSPKSRVMLILLLVLAAAAFVWWVYQPGPVDTAQSRYAGPVPVSVQQAIRADFPLVLGAVGTVASLNHVVIRSRVEGELTEILFTEGQDVKSGELLARIDPRSYEVRLSQALGQQQQNQAQLQNAQADLRRYQALFKQSSVARQQLDSQQALVRQYGGVAKSDQAQVDDARLQLTYTEIRAPISGRLGLRKVDLGNLIRSGDAEGLVTITQMQPISVLFSLPETRLADVLEPLRQGETLRVQAWDRNETKLLAVGELTTVDNQIDMATGTIKLRAQFPNADVSLYPNQFVNVRLQVREIPNAVAIPEDAVQYGSRGTYVYVVGQDSRATMRPVKLGPVSAGKAVIEEGLAGGDEIVLEGLDRLREGREVEIVRAPVASGGPLDTADKP